MCMHIDHEIAGLEATYGFIDQSEFDAIHDDYIEWLELEALCEDWLDSEVIQPDEYAFNGITLY